MVAKKRRGREKGRRPQGKDAEVAQEGAGYWSFIGIIPQLLLELLPSPPELYNGALMLCPLSCMQSSRLKVLPHQETE